MRDAAQLVHAMWSPSRDAARTLDRSCVLSLRRSGRGAMRWAARLGLQPHPQPQPRCAALRRARSPRRTASASARFTLDAAPAWSASVALIRAWHSKANGASGATTCPSSLSLPLLCCFLLARYAGTDNNHLPLLYRTQHFFLSLTIVRTPSCTLTSTASSSMRVEGGAPQRGVQRFSRAPPRFHRRADGCARMNASSSSSPLRPPPRCGGLRGTSPSACRTSR